MKMSKQAGDQEIRTTYGRCYVRTVHVRTPIMPFCSFILGFVDFGDRKLAHHGIYLPLSLARAVSAQGLLARVS